MVGRLLWEQDAAGSSPVTSTINPSPRTWVLSIKKRRIYMLCKKRKSINNDTTSTCSDCKSVTEISTETSELTLNKANNCKVLSIFALFSGIISLTLFYVVFVSIFFGILGIIFSILAMLEARNVKFKSYLPIISITCCCVGILYSIRVFVFDVITFIATKK